MECMHLPHHNIALEKVILHTHYHPHHHGQPITQDNSASLSAPGSPASATVTGDVLKSTTVSNNKDRPSIYGSSTTHSLYGVCVCVWGQPGLHNEFQASQGYSVIYKKKMESSK